MTQAKIYIGFDSRAPAAYWAQRRSILDHWAGYEPPSIQPLVQQGLRLAGLYTRPHDPRAATEFTYTRFLVPALAGWRGHALFMDGDMMARGDLSPLWEEYARPEHAVSVVKHTHVPVETTKMAGQVQETYPRKNWSSLMLWNCEHELTLALNPTMVNCATPATLHQFKWIPDDVIGELPLTYNWLEGSSAPTVDPTVVHFTRGIPGIHPGYEEAVYAAEYRQLMKRTFEGDPDV